MFKENLSRKIDISIIFLLAFIPRMICNFRMSPVMVIMDEICSINSAAYFAGLDWSKVVNIGGYYGIGYFGLFAPLFMINDNPYIIYYTVIVSLSILQSLVGVICYIIITRFFEIKDKKLSILSSVCCSYMVVARANNIVNESPMGLLTWIIIGLLLYLANSQITKQKKFIVTTVLMIVLCYSLLLHTRALTYWIALGILVVLYFLLYRKCIISIMASIISALLLVPMGKWVINNYQLCMWKSSEQVSNTSINIVVSKEYALVESIRGALSIILGEINTANVLAGGVLYIAFICCILIMIKCMVKRNKDNVYDLNLFIIIIFCGCCIGATIVGMVFSGWYPEVMEGIKNNITYDYYAYKSFTYLRYFGPYISPILLVLFLYMVKYQENMLKIIYTTILLIIPIQIYWMNNIIGLIGKNSTTHGAFILFSLWNKNKELGEYIYYAGIQGMVLFLFLFLIVYRIKREKGAVTLLMILLMTQYLYGSYIWDIPRADETNDKVDDTYAWIKELEDKTTIPTTIYVKDNIEMSHHKTALLYQFLLNRYEIRLEEPDKDEEEIILFINTEDDLESYENQGYKILRLDKEEYVCIKGERLLIQIE